MIIYYRPFFRTLKEKQISQYRLLQMGVNNRTLHKLRNNLPMNTETINMLCKIIHCQPGDIMEYVENEEHDS